MVVLFLNQSVLAQKTWEKSWKEWKRDDVLKILNNSPWAYSYSDIDIVYMTQGLNNQTTTQVDSGASPQIIVRLYSAQTVQRALVRMNQLDQKYDSMNAQQKAEFDERAKSFLNCANCKNYYIVILMQPGGRNAKNLIGNRFKDAKLEALKGSIYLTNDKGEKRELTQFAAPKSDDGFAVFYFDRFDANQKPLITKESKKFNVIFRAGKDDDRKAFLQEKVEFDVSKMIIDGEVDF